MTDQLIIVSDADLCDMLGIEELVLPDPVAQPHLVIIVYGAIIKAMTARLGHTETVIADSLSNYASRHTTSFMLTASNLCSQWNIEHRDQPDRTVKAKLRRLAKAEG